MPPLSLPTFPSEGKVRRKGLISSHWPQADATALTREAKTHKKPQVFTHREGEGERVFAWGPTRSETPLPGSPPPTPDPGRDSRRAPQPRRAAAPAAGLQ